MPPKPPSPPPAVRTPASHVQAAVSRHAPVTQAKPRVSPVAPPRVTTPPAPPAGPRQLAAHVQAKPAAQPQNPNFRILTHSAASGPRQIRIASGAQEIGSVELLEAGRDAVRVVNLKVDPQQRGQGAGAHLMRAAAFEGLRMGKTRITLESQDNGSGRLTRWYEGMGFTPRGVSDRGMVVLETTAATLQSRLSRQISRG